jgi:cation-transporting ATPase 13A3/4/5
VFGEEVPAAVVPDACAVAAANTPQERMALVMAACQSLRLLGTSLIGDPLEVVMLESSGWQLSTGDDDAVRVTAPGGRLCASQLQSFDFNSELARMAVVVRLEHNAGTPAQSVHALVKGSPEAIAALCDPATVPPNFEAMLAQYAGGGYRVLGLCERLLSAEHAAAAAAGTLARAEAEAAGQLRFVGLAVLENKLKPSSAGVIASLQAAAMNVCMITGDHARTAVTVGRAANILSATARVVLCDALPGGAPAYTKLALTLGEADEAVDAACALGSECESCRFVATGAGFDALLAAAEQGAPEALAFVLKRLSIGARFQPHQKQRAVNLFIEGGEFTAFVGDGANDSAALKAADVGLSLTADAEASVAAPFTSKDAELVSCITLLLEGRAALATAFQLFKYMAMCVHCGAACLCARLTHRPVERRYAAVQFSCSLQMNLADTCAFGCALVFCSLLADPSFFGCRFVGA